MRITTYSTALDSDKKNILVKERAFNYQVSESLCSPREIYSFMCQTFELDKKAEEYLYMIAFNTKQKVLGVFEISHGTVNQSLVSPREIYIRALLCGATGIALIHNHPSGVTSPSKEDMQVYKRIKEAGEIIGVPLLDNIIIGDDQYISFLENNY